VASEDSHSLLAVPVAPERDARSQDSNLQTGTRQLRLCRYETIRRLTDQRW